MDFPPRPPEGKDPRALWDRKNQDYLRSGRIIESDHIRPEYSRDGVALKIKRLPKARGGGGNTVIAVTVTQSPSTNTIVGEKDGELYTIALPRLLRGHTNQERTKSGTVNNIAVTENQRIIPLYFVGDVLLIEDVGADVTGLAGVDWTDRNEAARAWAAIAATLTP